MPHQNKINDKMLRLMHVDIILLNAFKVLRTCVEDF